MAISAQAVKELREKTGAGMLDCKKALEESGGDMEAAVDALRKKGVASAAKKSSRLASEGLIHIASSEKAAAVVEVNCETDFVAKNEAFQNFVKELSEVALEKNPASQEEFLALILPSTSKNIKDSSTDMIAKIGENINVRRFACLQAGEGEALTTYTHMGSKIGVLLKVASSGALKEEEQKGVAMHIAAMAPRFLNEGEISQDVLDREKEIYRAQLQESGKPAEMIDKILEGKIKKFATEVCLEKQAYIRDPEGKASVANFLKKLDPQAKVVQFVRFQVGEGLEKKQEDFAKEVASQISGK